MTILLSLSSCFVPALVPDLAAQRCLSEDQVVAVEGRLQALLERVLNDAKPTLVEAFIQWVRGTKAGVPGLSLHIEAPALCLSWSGAAGVHDPGKDEPLYPTHPFRIASITKTYVAAATLVLVEQGALGIDDAIATHLPARYVDILLQDAYRVQEITIRHLLTHTSGMYNYDRDEAYGETVVRQPYRRWTRVEQLQWAVDHGQPVGAPGETYAYSDTGYILLGEIIEQRTGASLATALRDLLKFEALGLTSTWMESVEPKPPGTAERAHQLYGALDTYDWDPSMDLYGGGGLVATGGDLARFFQGLFHGKVFAAPETLALMLQAADIPDPGDYRMGIQSIEVDGAVGWGHTGFWKTFAFHFPEPDVTVAGSIMQQRGPGWRPLVTEALGHINQAIQAR